MAVAQVVAAEGAHEAHEGPPQLARRARVDEGVQTAVEVAEPEGQGERQPGQLTGGARRVCNGIYCSVGKVGFFQLHG